MKKFVYLLVFIIAATISASAQTGSDNPFNQSESSPVQTSSNSVNSSNKFNQTDVIAAKLPPRSVDPINMPIDGGLIVLLGAGALYGRKRLSRKIA